MPQPPMQDEPASPGAPRRKFGGWTKIALLGAMLVGGAALGAGGLAIADAGHSGWMDGHGPRIERMQAMAKRTLDSVGATSEQEAKVHDIIAATFADLAPMRDKRQEFRKQAIELLKAPTIDAAAIEKLRADHMADMDAMSKRLTKAATDVAAVLTPEQRVQVADRIANFMERGPRRPWRHHDGDRSGRRGGNDEGRGDGDQQ